MRCWDVYAVSGVVEGELGWVVEVLLLGVVPLVVGVRPLVVPVLAVPPVLPVVDEPVVELPLGSVVDGCVALVLEPVSGVLVIVVSGSEVSVLTTEVTVVVFVAT
ncbi:MAG: hypothetical protein M1274_11590 [Actinobacteria bacterium]|nr:hypothetical protein [Actinomycetota bacterium]